MSDISKKRLYIGDFKIKNCSQYGEYEFIEKMKFGMSLKLDYEPLEQQIVVKVQMDIEDDIDKVNEWLPFGDVEMPEQIRKVMIPLLQGNHKDTIFECKLHPFDSKTALDDRFQVTVWAS